MAYRHQERLDKAKSLNKARRLNKIKRLNKARRLNIKEVKHDNKAIFLCQLIMKHLNF